MRQSETNSTKSQDSLATTVSFDDHLLLYYFSNTDYIKVTRQVVKQKKPCTHLRTTLDTLVQRRSDYVTNRSAELTAEVSTSLRMSLIFVS